MENVIYFERHKDGKQEHFFSTSYTQPNLSEEWVSVTHRVPNAFYKTKQEIVDRFLDDSTEVENPDSNYAV